MLQVQGSLCTGCAICLEACPEGAIVLVEERAQIDPAHCKECGICVEVCPEGAIQPIAERVEAAQAVEAAEPITAPSQTDPSQQIIEVKLPPPPAIREAPSSLAQRVLPAVGAALAYLGRELGPRLANLAADVIEDRLARSRTAKPVQRTDTSAQDLQRSAEEDNRGGARRRARRRGGRRGQ